MLQCSKSSEEGARTSVSHREGEMAFEEMAFELGFEVWGQA